MRKIAVALLLAWSSAVAAAEPQWTAENADCTAAIATAERSGDIPAGLLAAIGQIEKRLAGPDERRYPALLFALTLGCLTLTGQAFAGEASAMAAVTPSTRPAAPSRSTFKLRSEE